VFDAAVLVSAAALVSAAIDAIDAIDAIVGVVFVAPTLISKFKRCRLFQ
jgi:hypothetical protein